MTTKRFYRNRGTIWENDKSMSLGEVVDKLNDLHEDLNHELTVSKALRDVVKELEKENEHIKQTIKDMIESERTEIGKMTLRQLWRQIQ